VRKNIKRKTDFRLMWLGLLLVVALMAPSLGQAQEKREGSYSELQQKLVKELNLAPDKAKEFQAVGEKYDQSRVEIIGRIEKNDRELEKALAAPQPDEGKINELVAGAIAGQDQLFATFKAQRQEEMALLTPVQRGKFLMALKKGHQGEREKYEKTEKK
jgi:Spy/CpxP family protein refolding chaperone